MKTFIRVINPNFKIRELNSILNMLLNYKSDVWHIKIIRKTSSTTCKHQIIQTIIWTKIHIFNKINSKINNFSENKPWFLQWFGTQNLIEHLKTFGLSTRAFQTDSGNTSDCWFDYQKGLWIYKFSLEIYIITYCKWFLIRNKIR